RHGTRAGPLQVAPSGAVRAGRRWKNAIEQIHAHAPVRRRAPWMADAHQVARPIGGELIEGRLQHARGQVLRLADAQPADGEAGWIVSRGGTRRLTAQIAEHASLD